MLLDSRQSEALLAVLDSGSFEQAAASLHLTPSAVSQRVSAMEAAIGAPLVVRSRPCRATGPGQRLLQYLRRSRLLEQEFFAELEEDGGRPLSVALAVNNDTLATWLLPELAPFLIRERLLLDITLDDQDHTYSLLELGQAIACISSQPLPMRGCVVEPLGFMRYSLLGTPDYRERYFSAGFEREAARKAPVVVFDRKDMLQANFIQQVLGLPPGSYPSLYIPAAEAFLNAVRLGLGSGMLPSQQYGSDLETGKLTDLAPGRYLDVHLYWHSWRVQSPRLEKLSAEAIAAARRVLRQDDAGEADQELA
ncbi:LysR family transcriptional regulator ArgP [Massilia sp. NR 4-1]|uniref:LysR family transcriptional regulator ArgP n=1 Tax=Massilia sp. NR 4-1 TaxID=1678028 RepID=UPI00067AEF52|nr:LysR family transcriptional regulator ArgP [Massilia sp. NR 4-1]AKU21608.1 chromosome replication initiation inhibitor protein [Massilia sp. NR 4-1]